MEEWGVKLQDVRHLLPNFKDFQKADRIPWKREQEERAAIDALEAELSAWTDEDIKAFTHVVADVVR